MQNTSHIQTTHSEQLPSKITYIEVIILRNKLAELTLLLTAALKVLNDESKTLSREQLETILIKLSHTLDITLNGRT